MKHIFLIPFNKGKPNESWTTVMGINATRLLASRRGSFSYIENTPRVMTQEEQQRTFGEYDAKKLWAVVKVKDPQTNAEAIGYGWWAKDSEPYGTDKGNTKFNMASNRAERQALNRLRPGEMPTGIEVMDEALADRASKEGVIEGEFEEVKKEEVKEHWCPIHNVPFYKKGKMKWYAHTYKDANNKDVWCSEAKVMKGAGEGGNGEKSLSNNQEPPVQRERDTESLKTIEDLQKALKEDFGLEPIQQLAELNIKYWTDLTLTPAKAYEYVASTRR
jgi:hypothetical protein